MNYLRFKFGDQSRQSTAFVYRQPLPQAKVKWHYSVSDDVIIRDKHGENIPSIAGDKSEYL